MNEIIFFRYPIIKPHFHFLVIDFSTSLKITEVFKVEQKPAENWTTFFMECQSWEKVNSAFFQNHNILHYIKKFLVEILKAFYVYPDIFRMVIDIIRQIKENFYRSQMARPWKRNLALVINLSRTQKFSEHQFCSSIKNRKDWIVKCYVTYVKVLCSSCLNQ